MYGLVICTCKESLDSAACWRVVSLDRTELPNTDGPDALGDRPRCGCRGPRARVEAGIAAEPRPGVHAADARTARDLGPRPRAVTANSARRACGVGIGRGGWAFGRQGLVARVSDLCVRGRVAARGRHAVRLSYRRRPPLRREPIHAHTDWRRALDACRCPR